MARKPRRTQAQKSDDQIIEEAQKRFKAASDWEDTARSNAKQDRLMATADAYNMNAWPQEILNVRQPRGGSPRPCLTFNKIAQHNLHIINTGQQNQMGIKVNATGFGSTAKAAEGIEGLIRHIEYQSNAQQNAYFTASEDQVEIGIGYTHIVADYAPGDTFDQELYIRSVPDPFSVWLDPDCQEPDKSDARWGMIGQDMPRSEFNAAYPDHKDAAGVLPFAGDKSEWSRGWVDRDTVRVMRYYRRNETQDTLYAVPAMTMSGPMDENGQPVLGPDGKPIPGKSVPASVMRASEMPDELIVAARAMGFQSRPITDQNVEWFLVAGHEIIDRGDTVFDHVPIVPWIGREKVIDGVMDRWGHTRLLLDAQRMYNYSASEFVSLTALQSRVQWTGDARVIEGYEDHWANANTSNAAFLPQNRTDPETGLPIEAPQRLDPPTTPSAAVQGMANAEHQMQLVSGQYDAEMGAPGNERTGIAIQQRQRQADTATYHFTDRAGAALRLTGKILIGAIPKVYDTQRAIQVLGLDGTRTPMVVDPRLQTAHSEVQPPPPGDPAHDPNAEAIMAINPTIGRYDVEADVGPAYGTRRQEAFNAITQILQSAPELVNKIGDLLFKAADFPLSDEIAERLEPAGDDPNVAAANQQLQQAHAQIAQLNQKLADKSADIALKSQQAQHDKVVDVMGHEADAQRLQLDQYKAETDRAAALGSELPSAFIPVIQRLVADMIKQQAGALTPTQQATPAPDVGTPTGLDVARMPSMNPPGGPVHAPVPTNGAVQ